MELGDLFFCLVQGGASFLRSVTSKSQVAALACSDPTFVATAVVGGILGNHAWERWLRLLRRLRRLPEQVLIDKQEIDRLRANAISLAESVEALIEENACLVRLLAGTRLSKADRERVADGTFEDQETINDCQELIPGILHPM